jgi:hypothetical protein
MEYDISNAYALKALMERVLGNKAWRDLKHCQDLVTWKKYSKRLISAIHASIVSTVQVADEAWFEEISFEVEHGRKSLDTAKDLDVLFANLSAALGTISFLQVGLLPQRYQQDNVATRPGSNWKFDVVRSVQYVQSNNQKELQSAHNKPIKQD